MPRDANQGYHQSLREKLDTGVAEAMPLSLEGKLEVADHELAAAAYAIRAVMKSVSKIDAIRVAELECHWQHTKLSETIRELVQSDQQNRNLKI